MACFLNPFLGRLTDILGRCALVVSILFSSAVVSAYTISYVTGLSLHCLGAFFVCATFSLSGLYSAFVAKHSKQMARVRSFGLTIGTTTIAAFSSSLFIKHLFDVDPARTVRLLAIAILLFSVPLFVYVPFEKGAFKKDKSKRTLWPILTNTRLLVFFLAQAGAWFALGGVMPFLTSFLHKTVGLTIGQASEWAGLCSLISGASSILCGLLKQDSKERDLVCTCILLSALFTFIALSASLGKAVLFLSLILTNIISGFFYALSSAALSYLVTKEEQGLVFGLNTIFTTLSQAGAVEIFAWMVTYAGYEKIFFVSSCSVLVSAMLFKKCKK